MGNAPEGVALPHRVIHCRTLARFSVRFVSILKKTFFGHGLSAHGESIGDGRHALHLFPDALRTMILVGGVHVAP